MGGWGSKFEQVLTSFSGGVQASAPGDLIPDDAAPMVINGAWVRLGNEASLVEKRLGAKLLNTGTPVDSAIQGQCFYGKRSSTGSYTNYHILIAEDGDLHTIAGSTVSNHTSGEFTTSLTNQYISSVVANNYAYIVAGVACTAGGVQGTMLRFDGTNFRVGGMAAPAAPTAADTGVGVMSGTYEWAVSYRNSNTGYESSRSGTVSTTPSNEQTQVNWAASADAQVTHVNVHVRKATISTGFYRATSIAIGATTVTLNISDADYNALVIISPDEDENDPPPSGTIGLVWHKSRMFAATDTDLFYSKVELPESFDPEKYEAVNPDGGQKNRAIVAFGDEVLIFKDRSIYALTGNGPNDWYIREISHHVGCTSPGSIVEAEGNLYWWSDEGPMVWDGVNAPVFLGKILIQTLIDPLVLEASRLGQIVGGHDHRQGRIVWSVPLAGETRNNVMIPFRYQMLRQFEGLWYGIETASLMLGVDADGLEWLYLGGYGGRVYKWWSGIRDGVPPNGVYSGTFTAVDSTLSTVTSAGFDVTTGYKDLFVSVIDTESGRLLGRRRITTSTATTLTLASAFGGLTYGNTYQFHVGGINFEFDSKWQDQGAAFIKKRYEYLYLETWVDANTPLLVTFATDWTAGTEGVREFDLELTPGALSDGSLWDEFLWDVGLWAQGTVAHNRLRIAKPGRNWRIRINHSDPTTGFRLSKVGIRGEYLTDKR